MAIIASGNAGYGTGTTFQQVGGQVYWTGSSHSSGYDVRDTNDGSDGDGVLNIGETVYLYNNGSYIGTQMRYIGTDSTTGDLLFNPSGTFYTYAFTNNSANVDYYATYVTDTYSTTAVNYCFLSGTLITTPNGTTNVESLRIGDEVITTEGIVQKVKWVGIQNCHKMTIPTNRLPVIVRKDALGENIPSEDLYLSSDHALYVDGILAHAGALVNDISIVRINRDELETSFTYYHVELEDHSLILANNTPAETFVDNASREQFHNYAEYVTLYGSDESLNQTGELSLPRAMSQRQLPKAIKERLEIRALELFASEVSVSA
ncbi:MAG: Hint domain-containing protein [Sulfuricurvum sp.]|uniref:Hint domain-containing protein n=1 Tax=Sulfuricurvum sp. TaxID=2025608 RepID=UPI002620F58D|nr:Hint domain-containing protein [Sulfuricurvum sp.]MDD2828684.1 Hint domain-containing protein [Sulfuricurvum sp.]